MLRTLYTSTSWKVTPLLAGCAARDQRQRSNATSRYVGVFRDGSADDDAVASLQALDEARLAVSKAGRQGFIESVNCRRPGDTLLIRAEAALCAVDLAARLQQLRRRSSSLLKSRANR